VALRNERLFIDMPLSDFSVDFAQDWSADALQDRLFPLKRTRYETGTYVVFDAVRKFRTYRDLRADGAEANAISIKYGKATFSQEEYALRGPVTDRERDQSIDPISPEQDIVELVGEALLLRREERARDLIFPSGFSAETSTSPKWDAASSSITVIKDVRAHKKAFHKLTGKLPSMLIIPPVIWDLFFSDAQASSPGDVMVKRLQYTMAVTATEITPQAVARLLDVPEIVVPKILIANPALNGTATSASTGIAGTYLWDVDGGGTALKAIAYVYVNPSAGRRGLTLGWTFSSQPVTVFRYREDAKRTDWFEVSRVEQPAIVASVCMYRVTVLT